MSAKARAIIAVISSGEGDQVLSEAEASLRSVVPLVDHISCAGSDIDDTMHFPASSAARLAT
jgi:hypothetical protein